MLGMAGDDGTTPSGERERERERERKRERRERERDRDRDRETEREERENLSNYPHMNLSKKYQVVRKK